MRQTWSPREDLDLGVGWGGDTLLGRGAGGVYASRATVRGERAWLQGVWTSLDLTPHGLLSAVPEQLELLYAFSVEDRLLAAFPGGAVQAGHCVGLRWLGPYLGAEFTIRSDNGADGVHDTSLRLGVVVRAAIDTDVMSFVPVANPGEPPVEWGDPAPRRWKRRD